MSTSIKPMLRGLITYSESERFQAARLLAVASEVAFDADLVNQVAREHWQAVRQKEHRIALIARNHTDYLWIAKEILDAPDTATKETILSERIAE